MTRTETDQGLAQRVGFPSAASPPNLYEPGRGGTGSLYLACSDLDCDQAAIAAIYQKRWKVEIFHLYPSGYKNLKPNTALAKSLTQRVRTQSNHIFLSIYAAYRLECHSIKHKINHFALRGLSCI